MDTFDLDLMKQTWNHVRFPSRFPSQGDHKFRHHLLDVVNNTCPSIPSKIAETFLPFQTLDHNERNRQVVPVLESTNPIVSPPLNSSEALVPSMRVQEDPKRSRAPAWDPRERSRNTEAELNFSFLRKWIRVKDLNTRKSGLEASNTKKNDPAVPMQKEATRFSEEVATSQIPTVPTVHVVPTGPNNSKPEPEWSLEANRYAELPETSFFAFSSAASNNPKTDMRKRCSETEDSAYNKEKHPTRSRRGSGSKRTKTVLQFSRFRQRKRINKKIHKLKNLIPNCHEMDEGSILESTIKYLRTLQLQVQGMTMGSWNSMVQMAHLSSMNTQGTFGPMPIYGPLVHPGQPYLPLSPFFPSFSE